MRLLIDIHIMANSLFLATINGDVRILIVKDWQLDPIGIMKDPKLVKKDPIKSDEIGKSLNSALILASSDLH